MHYPMTWLYRPLSVFLAVLVAVTLPLSVVPTPARAEGFEGTVFKSDFDNAPPGPLSAGTPLQVNVGSVVVERSPVAIEAGPNGGGRVLVVNGGGSTGGGIALLRFSTFPGGLPQAANSRRYELRVKAEFTAGSNTTPGALFGLQLDDGSILEIFSFGPNGALARRGEDLKLAYTVNNKVKLEARFDLKERRMKAKLESGGRTLEVNTDVPSNFNPDTINQLRFDAVSLTANYTIDNVEVKVQKDDKDEEEKREPPAVIVINPPQTKVVVENNVSFIVLSINLSNSGGRAKGVFLILDLDDLADLDNLAFPEGIGYVKEINGRQVVIGLGENNSIRKDTLKLDLKLKVKGDRKSEVKVKFSYKIRFIDSDGERELPPVAVEVAVPAVMVVVAPPPVIVIQRLPIERIDTRFRTRWQRGGGLRMYGLPLTEPITLKSGIIVQYFERARFEFHPDKAGTEFEILLGRLSVELGYARPSAPPPTSTVELAWYFPATGHLIAQPFRAYWRDRGGLAIFGYPIGEAFVDENGRTIQYFERARLELHPDKVGTEFAILQGLLGEELLIVRKGAVGDD